MKDIVISTIEHKKMRYDTCGDYFESTCLVGNKKKKYNQIFVSKLSSPDLEFLIAVHEMIEQYLCEKRGIKEKDISSFDVEFEEDRKKGKHTPEDEPGDDKKAPYRREHFFAINIERQLAHELGVDWTDYEKEYVNLEY